MLKSRFIGGLLLIVGTSIGGGMLALPIANAAVGFWQSSVFLFLCWALMTLGALLILEVTLYLPSGSHMVTMAQATLGAPGLVIAWLSYLFLLYALLSGYISGGADVLGSLAADINIHLTDWQSSLLFTFLFGAIVHGGIKHVDLANRALMFGKLGIYALLVGLITPHISTSHFNLALGDAHLMSGSIMLLITAFGFAIIIPNLRVYFNDDVLSLRRVILIGSLIPLLCYIAWDAVILGSMRANGPDGIASLLQSSRPTSALASILEKTLDNSLITSLFNTFTSICMLTAFLGVALCLVSFLADGFKMETTGREGLGLLILALAPPLGLVLFFPGVYLHALQYAGIFCVILLLLLPACMALGGRKKFTKHYQIPGGYWTPALVISLSCILLWHEILQFFQ